jgi:ankyrin repeat protein
MDQIEQLEDLMYELNLKHNFKDIIALINNTDDYKIVNHLDEENNSTFLHMIVNRPVEDRYKSNQSEIFKTLLKKGCKINASDVYGFTVLHYCCNYNLIDFAKEIISHVDFDNNTINLKTVKQVKKEKFYYLIGSTPLQICSWLNNIELAEFLIEKGALVNEKNESGWSCIHICSRQNNLDFVKLLLKNNCNVDDLNNSSKNPLHISARHNNYMITKLLLENGANYNNKNKYGQTPLFIGNFYLKTKLQNNEWYRYVT